MRGKRKIIGSDGDPNYKLSTILSATVVDVTTLKMLLRPSKVSL